MQKKVILAVLLGFFFISCSDSSKTTDSKAQTSRSSKENSKIVLSKLDDSSIDVFLKGEGRVKECTFSNAKDKAVVVVYWSTSCPPCLAEIPHLNRLQKKFQDRVEIVGVLVENKEKKEIEEFVQYHGINYDIVYGDANYDLADAMGGVRGIPAMFMFKKDGTLHKNFVGLIPPEMIESEIEKII